MPFHTWEGIVAGTREARRNTPSVRPLRPPFPFIRRVLNPGKQAESGNAGVQNPPETQYGSRKEDCASRTSLLHYKNLLR